jgi:hypothetical protein
MIGAGHGQGGSSKIGWTMGRALARIRCPVGPRVDAASCATAPAYHGRAIERPGAHPRRSQGVEARMPGVEKQALKVHAPAKDEGYREQRGWRGALLRRER